jgi:hypothetical protein
METRMTDPDLYADDDDMPDLTDLHTYLYDDEGLTVAFVPALFDMLAHGNRVLRYCAIVTPGDDDGSVDAWIATDAASRYPDRSEYVATFTGADRIADALAAGAIVAQRRTLAAVAAGEPIGGRLPH